MVARPQGSMAAWRLRLLLVLQRQHSSDDSASWHPNGYFGAIDHHQHADDEAEVFRIA